MGCTCRRIPRRRSAFSTNLKRIFAQNRKNKVFSSLSSADQQEKEVPRKGVVDWLNLYNA